MLEVLGLAKSFGLQAIFKNFGLNLPHALATALEIILGIVLAFVTSRPLAIFMFARPGIEKGLAPFLVASQGYRYLPWLRCL
ncbi:hypothetical protein [Desulfobacter postgatei]|uniref:hypothetical protein n=1 Tax=Desulfobacter postgatei TaxID=2293 RepID=UPI00259BDF24|nr:hypothetical protein [uncultured Desulfobacter sp.]